MTLQLVPFIAARIPGDVGVRGGASLGSWSLSLSGHFLIDSNQSPMVLLHYVLCYSKDSRGELKSVAGNSTYKVIPLTQSWNSHRTAGVETNVQFRSICQSRVTEPRNLASQVTKPTDDHPNITGGTAQSFGMSDVEKI